MSRLLINYLLPLALPLAIYLTYIWWRRRRASKGGGNIPVIERNQVFISIIVGFLLMVSSLTMIATISGEAPGEGKYESPRFENGRITPPSFK